MTPARIKNPRLPRLAVLSAWVHHLLSNGSLQLVFSFLCLALVPAMVAIHGPALSHTSGKEVVLAWAAFGCCIAMWWQSVPLTEWLGRNKSAILSFVPVNPGTILWLNIRQHLLSLTVLALSWRAVDFAFREAGGLQLSRHGRANFALCGACLFVLTLAREFSSGAWDTPFFLPRAILRGWPTAKGGRTLVVRLPIILIGTVLTLAAARAGLPAFLESRFASQPAGEFAYFLFNPLGTVIRMETARRHAVGHVAADMRVSRCARRRRHPDRARVLPPHVRRRRVRGGSSGSRGNPGKKKRRRNPHRLTTLPG